jgi:HD-GYP domain-containing protein (c-di-GMP phosphodiesterase class II)
VRSVYDEAKRYAEALTMAYHHRHHRLDTRIVRIFNSILADEQVLRQPLSLLTQRGSVALRCGRAMGVRSGSPEIIRSL